MHYRKLVVISFILAIFPFLKILPITSEVQPFCILPMAYYIFKVVPLRLFDISYLYVSFILFLLGLIYSSTFLVFELFFTLIIAFVYLNFFINAKLNPHFINAINRKVILILVAYAVISIISPTIIQFLDIFNILSSRGIYGSMGGGRGVALLSPEPSYSSYIISTVLTISLLAYKSKIINSKVFFIDISAILFLLYTNKSIYSFLLALLVFSCLSDKRFIFYLYSILFVLLITFTSLFQDARVFYILADGFKLIQEMDDISALLFLGGSVRFTSVIVGYMAGYENFFSLFGSWKENIANLTFFNAIDTSAVWSFQEYGADLIPKPYSLFSYVCANGFVFFLYFIIYFWIRLNKAMVLLSFRQIVPFIFVSCITGLTTIPFSFCYLFILRSFMDKSRYD